MKTATEAAADMVIGSNLPRALTDAALVTDMDMILNPCPPRNFVDMDQTVERVMICHVQ